MDTLPKVGVNNNICWLQYHSPPGHSEHQDKEDESQIISKKNKDYFINKHQPSLAYHKCIIGGKAMINKYVTVVQKINYVSHCSGGTFHQFHSPQYPLPDPRTLRIS